MAITHIHKIEATTNKAILYAVSDKVDCARDNVLDSIAYAERDKSGLVTYYTLSSYQFCSADTAVNDFAMYSQEGIGKKKSRTKSGNDVLAWHLIQGFEEQLPPHIANEIGQKLAHEVFGDHACVISTHTNTDNTHNHIIVCAWNIHGKKWNNCNTNTRLIRQVSDRLCEEYGLSVLYNTQDMRLVKTKDKDGNIHYYEPTDRKNDIINKRNRGDASKFDVNSYNNTDAYQSYTEHDISNRELIKRDVDALLPNVNSYDNLLELLRNLGYEISDKKKNGEWLTHVTYKAPSQEKSTRDNRIGDGEFYTREKLTKYINKMVGERKQSIGVNDGSITTLPGSIKYFPSYDYGDINVSLINNDFRVRKNRDGSFETVKRGEAERNVIFDIKKKDAELYGLYDTSTIEKAINDYRAAKKHRARYISTGKERYLVKQIQESFNTLQFIEGKNILSYEQINNTVKMLWDKYNQCLTLLNKATDSMEQFDYLINLPDKEARLRTIIETKKGNPEYDTLEYDSDLDMAESYKTTIDKHNLDNDTEREELKQKYENLESRRDKLLISIGNFEKELNSYDRCMKVLERINNEYSRNDDEVLQRYEGIRREGEQQNQAEKNKAGKKKGERDR